MTIKKHGGIFGRNPTFNDVNVDGDLTVSGNLSANIEATTVTADSTVPLTVNRTGSQGDTIQIEDDGTKIGTVGVKGGALFLADVSGTGLRFESNGIVMTDGDGDKIAASYSLGLGAYPIGSIFLGSGHGIYMDGNNGLANFFDDYEEGTWTPTLTTNGTDFDSVTYDSVTEGSYTKVGNTVYFSLALRTDAVTVGSASGAVAIGGLPFTSLASSSASVSQSEAWAGEEPIAAFVLGSSTIVRLLYRASVSGNTANTAVADVGTGANGNEIKISGFYFV
jgi:hypothetical protein